MALFIAKKLEKTTPDRRKKRLCQSKQQKLFLELKKMIDQEITSIVELSHRIGKSRKQTRRYIEKMASLGMVRLNPETRMLVKTTGLNYESVSGSDFARLPEIAKWINDCIARDVKPATISQYVKCVKSILALAKTSPKNVIRSKKDAVEHWSRFMVEFRRKNPTRGTQYYRVSFKNFLASFDITFAPRMGKIYGLSSAHDKYGAYAGVSLSPEITKKVGDMILENDDLQLYVWWRVGLRTGARSKAISTMVWERIYFNEKNEDGSESFKLEQHETKDPRGHFHLGENGEWKTKYPPLDLKALLVKWKEESGSTIKAMARKVINLPWNQLPEEYQSIQPPKSYQKFEYPFGNKKARYHFDQTLCLLRLSPIQSESAIKIKNETLNLIFNEIVKRIPLTVKS